jgi:hypothetical protein
MPGRIVELYFHTSQRSQYMDEYQRLYLLCSVRSSVHRTPIQSIPQKCIKGLVFSEVNLNCKRSEGLSNPWREEKSFFHKGTYYPLSLLTLFAPYTLPYSFISLPCSESYSLVILYPLLLLYNFLISLCFPSKPGSHNFSGSLNARSSTLV